jgi:hypothetical protein
VKAYVRVPTRWTFSDATERTATTGWLALTSPLALRAASRVLRCGACVEVAVPLPSRVTLVMRVKAVAGCVRASTSTTAPGVPR